MAKNKHTANVQTLVPAWDISNAPYSHAVLSVSGQCVFENSDFAKHGGWYIGVCHKRKTPYTKDNFLIVIGVAWTWRRRPNILARWIIKAISFGNIVIFPGHIGRNN